MARGRSTGGRPHLFVFETKGEHLDNRETDYRRRLFETLERSLDCGRMTIRSGPAKGSFRIVFRREDFPAALAASPASGAVRRQRR